MFKRHRSENRYYREWNAKNKMSVVKESTSNAADSGSISGLGSSPGEGNGNPLQYCLENPMGGGAGWATVHGVAKIRTQLGDFTFTFRYKQSSACMCL